MHTDCLLLACNLPSMCCVWFGSEGQADCPTKQRKPRASNCSGWRVQAAKAAWFLPTYGAVSLVCSCSDRRARSRHAECPEHCHTSGSGLPRRRNESHSRSSTNYLSYAVTSQYRLISETYFYSRISKLLWYARGRQQVAGFETQNNVRIDMPKIIKEHGQALFKAINKLPQLILCLMPRAGSLEYGQIKRVGDVERGVATQCVVCACTLD